MKFRESRRPYRKEYPKREWEIKPPGGGMILPSDYYGSSLRTGWGANPDEISYGDDSKIREKQNTCRYCFRRFCLYDFENGEYKRCTFTSFIDPQCHYYEKSTHENPHIILFDKKAYEFAKNKLPLNESSITEEQERIENQNKKIMKSQAMTQHEFAHKSRVTPKSFVQLKQTDTDFATDLKLIAKYSKSCQKSRQSEHQLVLERIDAKLKDIPWLFNKKIFRLYKAGKIDAVELLVRGGYLRIAPLKQTPKD